MGRGERRDTYVFLVAGERKRRRELLEVVVDLFVWFDRDVLAEVSLCFIVELGIVDEQQGILWGNNPIRKEHYT